MRTWFLGRGGHRTWNALAGTKSTKYLMLPLRACHSTACCRDALRTAFPSRPLRASDAMRARVGCSHVRCGGQK